MDAYVIMPNHLHGIVFIRAADDVRARGDVNADGARSHVATHGRASLQQGEHTSLHRKPKSLGAFVAGFKSSVTRRINRLRGMPGTKVWQPTNYHDRILRDESELFAARQYIASNPVNWIEDTHHPAGE
jgi:REP element-mobilizing transposase RayT